MAMILTLHAFFYADLIFLIKSYSMFTLQELLRDIINDSSTHKTGTFMEVSSYDAKKNDKALHVLWAGRSSHL